MLDIVDNLSQIKRIQITVLGVVLMALTWYVFSYTELSEANDQLVNKNKTLSGQIRSISKMTARSDKLIYENHMISADKLASLLESILQDTGGLELVSLQKTANIALNDGIDDEVKGLHAILGNKLTATDIEIKLNGDYLSVVRYLQRVEKNSGSGGAYWQSLNYKVLDYPNAQIDLVLRTLNKG